MAYDLNNVRWVVSTNDNFVVLMRDSGTGEDEPVAIFTYQAASVLTEQLSYAQAKVDPYLRSLAECVE